MTKWWQLPKVFTARFQDITETSQAQFLIMLKSPNKKCNPVTQILSSLLLMLPDGGTHTDELETH